MGKGKISFKDFIRALKRANRKQIYGRLFALDKKTGEVCGCALGQGLLEYGAVTEDEVRTQLQKTGRPLTSNVFDPVTNTTEERTVLTDAAWESHFQELLNDLNEQVPGFTTDVIANNDNARKTIPQILGKFWDKWLPNGL